MRKLLTLAALLFAFPAYAQNSGSFPAGGGGGTPCTTTASSLQYDAAGSFGCVSGWTTNGSTKLTGTGGTVTTDTPLINLTETWNNSGTTFSGINFTVTNTASAVGSTLLNLATASAIFAFNPSSANSTAQIFISSPDHSLEQAIVFQRYATYTLQSSNGFGLTLTGPAAFSSDTGLETYNTGFIGFSSGSFATATPDTLLTRAAAASIQLGAADSASPVAQTIRVQSVVAGTSNTAGVDWIIDGSVGTGTGAGGNIIFQAAPAGTTGTSQNALKQVEIIDNKAHIRVGNSTAPALTSCGTSPAVVGDDTAGEVTMGTGSPTGCTITFNVAYASAPICTVTWQATALASQSYALSTTAITLTQTGTSSDKVDYICRARNGG